ncbi:energy transducer TonB [Treponema sp.]|uniref:energy transducer TonB n=1 Tax=Treponema sp. TaxID=166 RepID=UPI00257F3B12|nr:energy transducer TonB [Treponema sp.]MBE6354222.1 TonB family protein [Treponema sp.]
MNRWISSCLLTAALIITAALLMDMELPHKKITLISDDSDHPVTVTIIKKAPQKKIEIKKEIPEPEKNNLKQESSFTIEKEILPEEKKEIPEELTEEEIPGEESDINQNAKEEILMTAEQMQQAADYKTYALKRISSKKTYPLSSRSKGETGNVKLHVIILPDGSLEKAEITEACEFENLNGAALKAVRKASPFKKMKAGQKKLELTFIMEFSLTE